MIKKPRLFLSTKNKALMLIIEMELLILLIIALWFWRGFLNTGNIDEYANTENIPVITAGSGYLEYDIIRVKVPRDGASYVIGYDWARGDKAYPTVPSSASAYYSNDSGDVMYEVMLYRDRVIPKLEGDDTITLDGWYEEWERRSGDGSDQEAYATPNTRGFLINTDDETVDDSGNNKTYCSYAYYFAVETDSSLEQYVLEFNYYDPASNDQAEEIFKSCADSISLRKTA